ncbi:MAG: radical SAM protein [Candidatus Eremiobacteraeota bacterium]|nr:radical SAM protein [Candidatus Eremiobacteraeota bacterium]
MVRASEKMKRARELSRERFGKRITFYHPGMFHYRGEWGKYPALSITADRCELACLHCRGKLLEPMIHAVTPEELVKKCRRIKEKGALGVLVTGGSSKKGELPWEGFTEALREVKNETGLFISVHSGIVDEALAGALKDAGVDQALIDIIGDDGTFREVCRVPFGIEKIAGSLDALHGKAIPVIPHIIVGLKGGKLQGEYRAIEMVKKYRPEIIVIVSFMPLAGTPMEKAAPPDPYEVADVLAEARLGNPDSLIALGCARERGRALIDILAVECGVNRIAIPADEAVKKAEEHGLAVTWEKTCCSLPEGFKGGIA